MSKDKRKNMPKNRFVSKNEVQKWYGIANLFAKSYLSMNEAVYTYNMLGSQNRKEIQISLKTLDEQRKRVLKNVGTEEANSRYCASVFVDSHIIATEYDTDPVVVLMCVQPPCPISDRVVIK